MIKIVRALIEGTTVYVRDDEQGVAYVAINDWLIYCKALDIVSEFEADVDKQYEEVK